MLNIRPVVVLTASMQGIPCIQLNPQSPEPKLLIAGSDIPPSKKQVGILNIPVSPNQISANLMGGGARRFHELYTLNPKKLEQQALAESLRSPGPGLGIYLKLIH